MRPRAQRGSTLVEGCVILLVFMVVFVGILDMGQIMFFHNFLNDRARVGARYAVVHSFDANVIKNVVAYNATTGDGNPGLFGLAPSMIQVNRYDPGLPAERVEVSITTFQMRFISPWIAGSFTPRAFRAVMPVEGGGTAH